MFHYFKIIVITSDKNKNEYMHNYYLIKHNFSQFAIYNLKFQLKFCKSYNVVKIIIVRIVIIKINDMFIKLLYYS